MHLLPLFDVINCPFVYFIGIYGTLPADAISRPSVDAKQQLFVIVSRRLTILRVTTRALTVAMLHVAIDPNNQQEYNR